MNTGSHAVFTKLFCVKYKMKLSGINTRATIMIHSITDQNALLFHKTWVFHSELLSTCKKVISFHGRILFKWSIWRQQQRSAGKLPDHSSVLQHPCFYKFLRFSGKAIVLLIMHYCLKNNSLLKRVVIWYRLPSSHHSLFCSKILRKKKLWMGRITLLSTFTAAGTYIVPSAVHSSKCNNPELVAAALQVPELC